MKSKSVLTVAAAVSIACSSLAQAANQAPNLSAPQSNAPGTIAAPNPPALSYLQPTASANVAAKPASAAASAASAPAAAAPSKPTSQPKPKADTSESDAPAAKPAARRARKPAAAPDRKAPALPSTFDLKFSGDIWKALQMVSAKRPLAISASGRPVPLQVHLDLRNADLIEALRAIGDQTGDAADLEYNNLTNELRLVYKTVAAPVAPVEPPATKPIEEVRNWQNGAKARPIAGPDGMLLYPFGQVRPTLTCKPLRGCAVQLQPGEVVNNVIFGDTVRWVASPATVGNGNDAIQQVVLKPTEENISTNLRITTNRRSYVLEVNSNVSSNYVETIGYYYPQDMVQEWNGKAEVERRKLEADAARKVSDLPITTIDQINLDSYRLKGDSDLPWYPVRVFDEGTHVWIQMPPSIKASEAPALVLLDASGNTELVNYRVKEAQQGGGTVTYYIVDKLFAKAALIVGVGGDQQKVEIIRKNKTAWFGTNN